MSTETNQNTNVNTHTVAVHKASLPLRKDESIGEFTQGLSEAARAFVMGKKRMDPKTDYCYAVEVYSGSAVVSYSIYGDGKQRAQYGYVAVMYSRDDNGAFSFSDMTEVERVTTYRAKSLIATAKSHDGQNMEAETFLPGQGVHGWSVKKSASLFAGVV